MTALVAVSIASKVAMSVEMAKGFGGKPASGNTVAGSWRSSRDRLRVRNAASSPIDSQRPTPVGHRSGRARTSTASATS